MTDSPLEGRRFTEQEVRAILKKAVERKGPSTGLTRRDGLSLSELKGIGEEVGIDPARLEEAARAVVRGDERKPSLLAGGAVLVNYERSVQGTLSPADTSDVISVIRRTVGAQGELSEIHGSLEWRNKGDGGEQAVTVSERDGSTTIRSFANLSNALILTYLPTGIVGVLASVVGLIKFFEDGAVGGLVLALVLVPILYGILRTVYGQYSRRVSERMELVVEELARMIGERGE